MLNVPITPPRVPLIDERTGLIDRAWYLFFLSLNNAIVTVENVDVGPNADTLVASYDAALRALAQDVSTLPIPADLSVELSKQIEAAGLTTSSAGLLSTVAEMQKQIEALNSLPPVLPSPITNGAAILYGDNLGGFSNVTIGSGVSFAGGTLSATGTGGTVTSVTGTAPVVSSGGTTPAISMAAASTSVNGYLTSTDWNTFNGKQPAGTYVTAVSVASANGLAGTSSGGATPALTLSTSVTGLLKGNGTAISAAVANTDYVPLSTVLTKTADYTITGTDTWIINNKSGSAMTLTFPAASAWTGRYITVKNMQAQLVNSASSNIVPIDSTTPGTAILLAVVGNWATMVSDGTNWVIMQQAANNCLLLE